MNNASAIVRSLVVYAVCVTVAVILGYQLTDPLTRSTFMVLGLLSFVLIFPLLLRWHHFLLFAFWNVAMVVFFLSGSPPIWMLMVAISLGIALLQRALNRNMRFISVPQVTWPLLCMIGVVLLTAKMTGGFGLRALGNEVYGGKRYVFLIGGILAYFALTSRPVPQEKIPLYLGVFFLCGLTAIVGDLFSIASPSLYFIFYLFPPNYNPSGLDLGTARIGGAVGVASAGYFFLLARYGLRGIFDFGKPWRMCLLMAFIAIGMLGGFRSLLILFIIQFAVQFYLEGLHRTKLLPILFICGLLFVPILIPFANRLPYTFQRTIAFLPLNLDARAVNDADYSSEWRVKMWKAVLPQVPNYLLLGKGYALSPQDYDSITSLPGFEFSSFEENSGSALTSDFHNGPLSVVISFGIWGVITFLWFVAASARVLYINFRYSPPELKTLNGFLLALFVTRITIFFFVFGSLYTDIFQLASVVGLSVSFNNGVHQTVRPVAESPRAEGFAGMFSRPRPI